MIFLFDPTKIRNGTQKEITSQTDYYLVCLQKLSVSLTSYFFQSMYRMVHIQWDRRDKQYGPSPVMF